MNIPEHTNEVSFSQTKSHTPEQKRLSIWLILSLLCCLAGCFGGSKLRSNFSQPAIPGKGWGTLLIGQTSVKELVQRFGPIFQDGRGVFDAQAGPVRADGQELSSVTLSSQVDGVQFCFVGPFDESFLQRAKAGSLSVQDYLAFPGKLQRITFRLSEAPLIQTDRKLELLDLFGQAEKIYGNADGSIRYQSKWARRHYYYKVGLVVTTDYYGELKELSKENKGPVPASKVDTYPTLLKQHGKKIDTLVTSADAEWKKPHKSQEDCVPLQSSIFAIHIVEPFVVGADKVTYGEAPSLPATTLLAPPGFPSEYVGLPYRFR